MTGADSSTIRPTTQRRPRRVVGVLAAGIAAEVVAGVVGAALLATGQGSHHAGDPHSGPAGSTVSAAGKLTQRSGSTRADGRTNPAETASASRNRAVQALLTRRAAALQRHDRAAFVAAADPQDPRFRAAQGRLFDNLAGVPLRTWSYSLDGRNNRVVAAERARLGGPSWSPDVLLSYRLAGFDARPTTEELHPVFVERHGRWYLAASTDGHLGGARDLWDFGPVIAVRTPRVLVLGHPGSRPVMRSISSVVAAAIPRVTAVWGDAWPQRVVVLVPRTQRELTAVVDDGTDLAQIAAVATAELADHGAPTGERVIVSPSNFGKLGVLGRRVVLTHEITHIAARAVTSESTPEWLAEGFADYIGYRGTGVATRFAAAELVADLRSGDRLGHLPTAADFAGDNAHLPEVYEQSWLACRLLARDLGPQGLVAFYRAVSSRGGAPGAALDVVLRQRLGLSTAEFTQQWRRYVGEQLR